MGRPAKKTAAAAKKNLSEKSPAVEEVAEKAPVEKENVEQAPIEKELAEKAPIEKEVAEKAPLEKVVADKAPAKKVVAKKVPASKQKVLANGTSDMKEKMAVQTNGTPRKRGRPSHVEVPAKKLKLDFRHSRGVGHVLTVGQGDTGQLGLGEDIMEKSRPGLVSTIKDAVDVVAGGMHSAVLDKNGQLYTFGCNDEGALGRAVEEEEECFTPGKVEIEGKIVLVSAGDSHTAVLTEDGKVYAWGTFRDSSGPIGLTPDGVIQKLPIRILRDVMVTKISSGSDHIVALTADGDIYSMGNSEQGQLGRVPERFAHRGGRRGLSFLLSPDKLHVKKKSTVFKDVWAGSYNTIARTTDGEVLVMGLNNYNQMGLSMDKGITFFLPTKSGSLESADIQTLSLGQHHTTLINQKNKIMSLGRSEYGRLGLGENLQDAEVPTLIPALGSMCVVDIACGTAVSYAVTDDGECYSWGMGTNGQLGTGEEEDVCVPTVMKSKQLENRSVIAVSSGGQHTILLAKDK